MSQHLLMYDSLRCSFLRIKKPPRQPKCCVCGESCSIKSMSDSAKASEMTRGPSCSNNKPFGVDILQGMQHITPEYYQDIRRQNEPHILLDVRVPEQFELCSLPGAVNIRLKDLRERIGEVEELSGGTKVVYCICRRGIASVAATQLLNDMICDHPNIKSVVNVRGGLDAWRQKVDKSFPRY